MIRVTALLVTALMAGDSAIPAWGEEKRAVGSSRKVEGMLVWEGEKAAEHDYLVFLPEGYGEGDKKKQWPMIVYLHGGGGTAKNVEKRLAGLRKEPFVILAPLCPPLPKEVPGYFNSWNAKAIGAVVRKVSGDFAIDKNRVSLMGFSMGGSGAWKTPYWNPELFDKVVVISGSCHPWHIYHYPKIPVRVYSGAKEKWLLQHKHSVETAKQFGVDVTHTIWPGAGHGECCSRTLRDPYLRRWLRGEAEKEK